jgi:hypothetical protein
MSVNPSPEEETLTENSAFAELLNWADSRPAWQRDGPRRLIVNGAVTPGGVDDLAEICLDPKLPYELIRQTLISTHTAAGQPIAILGIEMPASSAASR